MYCSNCGNQISDEQQFCEKCGTKVAGPAQGSQHVVNVRDKSAGIAAVLSFFIMGLGQMYVGKIVRGLLFLLGYIVFAVFSYAFVFLVLFSNIDDFVYGDGPLFDPGALGLFVIVNIVYLVVWIWNIFDAYKLANEYNDYLIKNGKRPW